MPPGPRNLITDVPGLAVGNAENARAKTGTTVVLFDEPAVASVKVLGGAPGTREAALLEPEQTVGAIDALVLSGGSAFGLDAAGGVMARLAERGRGFAVGNARVPIVPEAILFDLMNGGDKDWGMTPPFRDLGITALDAVSDDFALGTAGAGFGATTATLKGGLGSASTVLASGHTVGALVAVNALGSATIGDTGHFWAAAFEEDGEFGGLGWPRPTPETARAIRTKSGAKPGTSTTIAVVATDAILTKAEAKRLATAAHDGIARALWPAHTPLDGDLVFAASTGKRPLADPVGDSILLGAAAAATLARAIARGVHAATAGPGDTLPTWQSRFGKA
ncbi:L-aminopeptidase/D-esterase-like protein [Rhodobium orientis]|uniref:Peptidase T4 n=1 Tax=Rhodobium orientis TaxID=34017 RepID=A0A327JTH5_9HYPH|nr:P1 family peptidase [Rhodobium orientis]MBB4301769.1 L-aminopeptidase/D-esterase-like protein [Rhodobium orientis]MBK5950570.1 peptidase T4 [Rhodobium orientis]RAI28212.1 peptidase T4 [Rhodobium orientis]